MCDAYYCVYYSQQGPQAITPHCIIKCLIRLAAQMLIKQPGRLQEMLCDQRTVFFGRFVGTHSTLRRMSRPKPKCPEYRFGYRQTINVCSFSDWFERIQWEPIIIGACMKHTKIHVLEDDIIAQNCVLSCVDDDDPHITFTDNSLRQPVLRINWNSQISLYIRTGCTEIGGTSMQVRNINITRQSATHPNVVHPFAVRVARIANTPVRACVPQPYQSNAGDSNERTHFGGRENAKLNAHCEYSLANRRLANAKCFACVSLWKFINNVSQHKWCILQYSVDNGLYRAIRKVTIH